MDDQQSRARQPDPSPQSPSSVTSLCRVLACKVAAPSFVPGRVIGQKRIDQNVDRRNGSAKKTDRRPSANPAADGIPRFVWSQLTAAVFALSPGHDHDAQHGRALLEELGPMPEGLPLLMDRRLRRPAAISPSRHPTDPHSSSRASPANWPCNTGRPRPSIWYWTTSTSTVRSP